MPQNTAFCVLQVGLRSDLRSAFWLRSHCVLRTLRSRCVLLLSHCVLLRSHCVLHRELRSGLRSGALKRGCVLQNTAAFWLAFCLGHLRSQTLQNTEHSVLVHLRTGP